MVREGGNSLARHELNRALSRAVPLDRGQSILNGDKKIWDIVAAAVVTEQPGCVNVWAGGKTEYPSGLGIAQGLSGDSALPMDIEEWFRFDLYGDADWIGISEERIVLIWSLVGTTLDHVVHGFEFVPSDAGSREGDEVEWEVSAQINVIYCYDEAGQELPNFDRASLPPFSLAGLTVYEAKDLVRIHVRELGEIVCEAGRSTRLDLTGLDPNIPAGSGAAEGSSPTPAMLDAIREAGLNPEEFEYWHVTPHRALFASLDDRARETGVIGQVIRLTWLGYDDRGYPHWGADDDRTISIC